MEVKYDKIGGSYNSTRKADPFLVKKLLAHLQPIQDGIYLEIGCGTGNYTHELEKKGLRLIGIDPSKKMLEIARLHPGKIDWKIGHAEHIDLPDNSIDGAIAFLTIHHWTDLKRGFSELGRVLTAWGRIVIFTSTPKQMEGYWLNHYFPKMLEKSIVQMPRFERLKTAMNQGGFQVVGTDPYFVKTDLEDKFLYCGKHNPDLYFDEQIRRGISSFSSLSNGQEVKQGLSRLRADITEGRIDEIMESYKHHLGDYLFVIGEKKAIGR